MKTSTPRDERRRQTEQTILSAARELFAEVGFERTTIRAVAAAASVDPALVMQYYGSKERLFAEASRWDDISSQVLHAELPDVPRAALADFFALMESDRREGFEAMMRNCLTHPAAAAVMRDEVVCGRRDAVAGRIDAPDAELRATLLGALMMGMAMSRGMLQVEPLVSASREDLERVLLPVLQALVQPDPDTAGPA